MAEAERLCATAEVIGCPTIQLVPFCGLEGRLWKEILELTAKNVADIAAYQGKPRSRWSASTHHSQSVEAGDFGNLCYCDQRR